MLDDKNYIGKLHMFNEDSELIKDVKIDIKEKNIIRICKICGKKYKDTQIIIGGIPNYSYAVCDDCKKKG